MVVVVVVNAFFDGNFDSKWVAVPSFHVFLSVRKIIFYIRWTRTVKDPHPHHKILRTDIVL